MLNDGDLQPEELRRGTPVQFRWGLSWYRGRVRETAYDIRDIRIYVPSQPKWSVNWQMTNEMHVRLDDRWHRLFSQGGRMTLRPLTDSDRVPPSDAVPLPESLAERLLDA